MADDWDDWGDGDEQSDGAKSEGWDWPADERRPAASAADKNADEAPERMASRGVDRMTAAGGGGLLPGANDQHIEEKERLAEQMDKMTEKFFVQLQRYLEDLADPSAREEINEELTRRDFGTLAEYYDQRDDLAGYTLDTELQRMRYSLVTEEGKQLAQGEPEAIREFLNDRRGDAMVRMANQSIFADMLQALQGRLLRPDLEISVVSRDCGFSLDFNRGVLEASSVFGVSTVGCGEPGAQETLEIAQIKGTACVDTRMKKCTQRLLSPQLRMVFDDDMRASARVLARHSLMDGGMNGERGQGVGGWVERGAMGLQGMGALRESLARASSDGMGRAAAAGTGLLANVVASVGTAIGASRNGNDLSDLVAAGARGGGARFNRRHANDTGDPPEVRLYRREDGEHPARASPQSRAVLPKEPAPAVVAGPPPVDAGESPRMFLAETTDTGGGFWKSVAAAAEAAETGNSPLRVAERAVGGGGRDVAAAAAEDVDLARRAGQARDPCCGIGATSERGGDHGLTSSRAKGGWFAWS